MKKFKNWMDKPFTWGGYLKLCGMGTAIGIIVSLAMTWPYYSDNIRIWFDEKIHPNKNEFKDYADEEM